MTDTERSRSRSHSRRRKMILSGAKNRILWSDLMESRLDGKVDGWAIVQGTRQKPPDTADAKDRGRYRSDSAKTIRIIIESISDDMYTLVVGEKDPKALWEKLSDHCNQKGPAAVYTILQELLNYAKLTKAEGYAKPVIQSCGEIKILAKRLRNSIADGKDVIDSIAIAIWLNSLHSDLDNVIENLHTAATMEEMQAILSSHEQIKLSRRATGVPSKVAMKAKTSNIPMRQQDGLRCYSCYKYGHIAKDCLKPNKKKRKTAES